MHKIVNFQSIPGQQLVNQKVLDPQTLEEIRQQKEERRRRTLSRIKLGATGLGGLGAIVGGAYLARKGHRNLQNRVNKFIEPALTAGVDIKNHMHNTKRDTAYQILGNSLGLYGAYLLGKTAKKLASKTNTDDENK